MTTIYNIGDRVSINGSDYVGTVTGVTAAGSLFSVAIDDRPYGSVWYGASELSAALDADIVARNRGESIVLAAHVVRAASALTIAVTLYGAAMLGIAAARADSIDAHVTPDGRTAVYLSDVAGLVDVLPVCAVEDCSDQGGQMGVWTDPDTGDAYLELGETVTLVIDDDSVAGAR